ncbi:MAG: serine hydrolase [Cyanobacteria bacterium Co-bin8]|nr:serine hydrolase [Cyanobacteria bacterium Co-bin8]
MRPSLKAPISASLLLLSLVGAALMTDWRFWSRAATYPKSEITSTAWYRPQDPVPGQSGAPLPQAQTSSIPAAALREVSRFAQAQNSTALIVLHRGQVVLEEYWQGYSPASLSNSMSMAKSILALLIGIAIEEGHIGSVEDRVADYIPEWANDSRGDLTLADLLYMQSGLRNDDRTNTPASDLVNLYLSSNVEKKALHIPQVMLPRQVYDYNNVNSQVLSIVLERATGETYADYLSSRLWQPLQASDAFVWLDRPGGQAKTFCCLFATPSDWVRVGQLLLNRGRVGSRQVVPEHWINQMLQESPIEPTFGYHIWIKARTADYPNVDQAASAPFLATDTVYLDGRGHQRVYIIPSQELVIVRIGELPAAWDDAVLPNLLLKSLGERP